MGREGLKVEQMGIEGRTLYSFLIFFLNLYLVLVPHYF